MVGSARGKGRLRKFRVLNNRKAARSDVGRTGSDREASYDRPRSLYFIL